jgi:hypothetical protein
MLRDEEIEVSIGRCQSPDGKIGDFMQVVHRPTGIQRHESPIQTKKRRELERRLRSEIEAELIAKGLTQYLLAPVS